VTIGQGADPTASGEIIHARMVIRGKSVDTADGARFDVVDPAHRRVIATAPLGSPADVDASVAAAQAAYGGRESGMPALERYTDVKNVFVDLRS